MKHNEFTRQEFGIYKTVISTEKGDLHALLHYQGGMKFPIQINAVTMDYTVSYTYFNTANTWLLDKTKNELLFKQIAYDWKQWCSEYIDKTDIFKYYTEIGCCKASINGASILIPNKVGDGSFAIYSTKEEDITLSEVRTLGFSQLFEFKDGVMKFTVNGGYLYVTGHVLVLTNYNGDIMVWKYKVD